MTQPVEVFPGDTLMLTVKSVEDWYLLKPTYEVRHLVGYMAVYWADVYDVEILAIIILGNHIHIIYRHRTGLGPLFCQMMLHWIARLMNQRLGRTGQKFFAPGPCRPMRCPTPKDVESKLDYVVTNATQHGLAPTAYAWPGLLFGPEQVGDDLHFKRPPELKNSKTFVDATLAYAVPAPFHLRHLDNSDVRAKFQARRKSIEAEESRRRRGNFMGVDAAMAVPRFGSPAKPKRSEFKPFFSSSCPRTLADAKRSRAVFLSSHKARLTRFREGDLTSDWPPGTYKMRRTYGLPPP